MRRPPEDPLRVGPAGEAAWLSSSSSARTGPRVRCSRPSRPWSPCCDTARQRAQESEQQPQCRHAERKKKRLRHRHRQERERCVRHRPERRIRNMQAARVKKFSREEAAAKLPVQLEVTIRGAGNGTKSTNEQDENCRRGRDSPPPGIELLQKGRSKDSHVALCLPLGGGRQKPLSTPRRQRLAYLPRRARSSGSARLQSRPALDRIQATPIPFRFSE